MLDISTNAEDALLRTDSLDRVFHVKGGALHALSDVTMACRAGTSLGVVGESGCGKSTLNRLLLMLDHPTGGDVLFRGKSLSSLTKAEQRVFRTAVQPVFQNPYSSLNPRLKVRRIIAEPLVAAARQSRAEVGRRIDEVLEQVGLSSADGNRLPSEFSGGQRQRIAIARALASKPELILLDEPVSSQDLSIRAQILNLLKDLQDEYGLATLFVSHDLATVRFMCEEVIVIYLGRIVEQGPVARVCEAPAHPYTRALLSATLPADPDAQRTDTPPVGEIPSPLSPPPGCPYHPRCAFAKDICRRERPVLADPGDGSGVACHMAQSEEW